MSSYSINLQKMKKHSILFPRSRQGLLNKKLPQEQIAELSNKQYKKAMQFIQRRKDLIESRKVETQPLDPQCTFEPESFTKSYRPSCINLSKNLNRSDLKTESRLLQWGKQRNEKNRQKNINATVKVQQNIVNNLKHMQQKKNPSYLQSFQLLKSHQFSVSPSRADRKMQTPIKITNKSRSQSTVLSAGVKSRSTLLSKLLE